MHICLFVCLDEGISWAEQKVKEKGREKMMLYIIICLSV